MTYLLDTCILSTLRKIRTHPEPKLLKWFKSHPETDYYICSITVGEIERGIAKLPLDSLSKMILEDWFHGQLIPQFCNRILDYNKEAALRWGRMTAENEKKGRHLPIQDAQIAAIADTNHLTVVTFNIKDFQGIVEAVNPLLL
ncbi:MAG: type II toxin-antitoxin system VapC family toxin [Parachlamydiaceae bacterium]|nr:type II toxin-antitoxin system VapC family toxin [Parachlamydiaceae bacterium]